MTDSADPATDWLRLIVVGLLFLVAIACVIAGGTLYFWIIADYLEAGAVPFTGLQLIGWLMGLIAAGVMAVGLVVFGIGLRVIDWQQAPRASLILSIVAVLLDMATYNVFSNTGHGDDSIQIVLLRAACILALIIVVLPPFLHWLRSKPVGTALSGLKP